MTNFLAAGAGGRLGRQRSAWAPQSLRGLPLPWAARRVAGFAARGQHAEQHDTTVSTPTALSSFISFLLH